MKNFFQTKPFKKMAMITAPLALAGLLLFPAGQVSAHCDAVDGPVVQGAKKALETGNINYALRYVTKEGEAEVKEAFQKTVEASKESKKVRDIVEYWFYETVVRVHRAGEGAEYTGLKEAGIDYGPALPAAEKAIHSGSTKEVKELILHTIELEIDKRFAELQKLPTTVGGNVEEARARAEAELLFQKYIHQLYADAISEVGHGDAGSEEEHSSVETPKGHGH